jgi:hypothetical protein
VDTSNLVGGVVALVAGLAIVASARSLAGALLNGRTTALRRNSLLNQERVDREIRSFDNPQSLVVEIWLVRGFGLFCMVGGLWALVS